MEDTLPTEVDSSSKHLFAHYCGLTDETQILQRAAPIRAKGLQVYDTSFFPYRCIKEWRFMVPRVLSHPLYATVVKPRLPTAKILDIGCCMGTDIRQFLIDGAQASNIVGIDISEEYINLGFELFEDKEKTKDCFQIVDILKEKTEAETETEKGKEDERIITEHTVKHGSYEEILARHGGTFDFVYAGSVLHLLLEDQVIKLLERVKPLLKSESGIFFGQTVGSSTTAGLFRLLVDENIKEQGLRPETEEEKERRQLKFLHTESSLKRTMEEIGYSNVEVRTKTPDVAGRYLAGVAERAQAVLLYSKRDPHHNHQQTDIEGGEAGKGIEGEEEETKTTTTVTQRAQYKPAFLSFNAMV